MLNWWSIKPFKARHYLAGLAPTDNDPAFSARAAWLVIGTPGLFPPPQGRIIPGGINPLHPETPLLEGINPPPRARIYVMVSSRIIYKYCIL